MKAIMISIKPKWVAKILNGEKTREVRKIMPNCHLPIDVYIYCTKDKVILYENVLTNNFYVNLHNPAVGVEKRNGKVVAKFTLNKCQEWHSYSWQTITKYGCVSDNELREYSKGHKSLYIWHISNLEIFEKPKEISEFKRWVIYKKCENCPYGKCDNDYGLCSQCCEIKPLTKAPQSWCYVEVEQ